MTPGDPFRESGYARVGRSGELQPLTPDDLAHMEATVAYWPDRDHALDHNHCFLCGSILTTDTRSEEHVFPQWLQRDLNLWQETITLLNGTTILGHEVAATAIALRAQYVSAQIRLFADELVVFSYEHGRVWVTGRGYEVELTRRPEW